MRFLILIPVLTLNSLIFCQDPVIINDPQSGVVSVYLEDTILNAYGPFGCEGPAIHYLLDLDNDTVNDIEFIVNCFLNGMADQSSISIKSTGNYSTIVDTGFVTVHQYFDFTSGQVVTDTIAVTVVNKFVSGDTIFFKMPTNLDVFTTILNDDGFSMPPFWIQSYRILHFWGDTSYIAFYKQDSISNSIYFLKVYVKTPMQIELLELFTNEKTFGISDQTELQPIIFPNPATNALTVRGEFEHIEILTLQGVSVYSTTTSSFNTKLDIGWLKKGLFIVRLKNQSGMIVKKLIKN